MAPGEFGGGVEIFKWIVGREVEEGEWGGGGVQQVVSTSKHIDKYWRLFLWAKVLVNNPLGVQLRRRLGRKMSQVTPYY